MSVLLVSMPFGALDRPGLGISLLKARLEDLGIACDVRYLNFTFAEMIGVDDFVWINADLPHTAFAAEWTFTDSLYGPRPEADAEYIQHVLRGLWGLNDAKIGRLLSIKRQAGYFIEHCLHAVAWDRYDLVGFTSTFEQNIASLAMARQLKAHFPRIKTVFGGANWEGDMGAELHRQFPFVDFVCGGEADHSFPALVQSLAGGHSATPSRTAIPGIIYRASDGASRDTGPPQLCTDMDAQPVPDYSDYFGALSESSVESEIVPSLLMETSRGCWWGAKSHCTFCGLNGSSMTFRSKSGDARQEFIEVLHA